MSGLTAPLRFEPIFQYRLWGGRRLERVLETPLPGEGPIGEAWVLSDRDDFPSVVADGAFQGRTLSDLVQEHHAAILGRFSSRYERFPLLLKFLDAREMLSVQVHPSDDQADLLPPGERGKTEAWVVLEADADSAISAGLKPGTTPTKLKAALAEGSVEPLLHRFVPKAGDGVFLQSGTVHALGGGVMVFEVQENSDVTFRLHDWGRVDAKTGSPRELHIEQGLRSIDFDRGPVDPVDAGADPLFDCEHFRLWRRRGADPFAVGETDEPRVLVCLEGSAEVSGTSLRPGDVVLLPASRGRCTCRPVGMANVLEIAL